MREADNLTTFMCRMSCKSGSLNLLEPSGPHRACYGTALPFFIQENVTRMFITVFTKASTGPCPETYYSNPQNLIVSLRPVLILSRVGADIRNVPYLQCFRSNPCIVSHAYHMLCPFHYFVFDHLNKRFVKCTDHEAPLYVIMSIIMLL